MRFQLIFSSFTCGYEIFFSILNRSWWAVTSQQQNILALIIWHGIQCFDNNWVEYVENVYNLQPWSFIMSETHRSAMLPCMWFVMRKRVFRHTDSVAPDQPTHTCSLIWELHCPLFCKLGSDWFVSRQCSSEIRICPKTHFRMTRLDLDCPHMAYSTYLSGSYINIVWTWIKRKALQCVLKWWDTLTTNQNSLLF